MTSKPSATNCPKTFASGHSFCCSVRVHFCLFCFLILFSILCMVCHLLLGGYCGGVPPLPIPNREVKPACADGTAMQCGRVGGRLFFWSSGSAMIRSSFFVYIPDGSFIIFSLFSRYKDVYHGHFFFKTFLYLAA